MSETCGFHGFLGCRALVRRVRRIADGALRLKRPMPPRLLTGPSGIGKTSLAEAIAKHMGTQCRVIVGRPDLGVAEILEAAGKWQTGDVVFLEEAHALSAAVQELFYGVLDKLVQRDTYAQDGQHAIQLGGKVTIPAITIIAATDQPERLLQGFRKRFGPDYTLSWYDIDDMILIVRQQASDNKLLLSSHACREIAEKCHGVPRNARQIVVDLIYYYTDRAGTSQLRVEDVREYFTSLGYDALGRTLLEQRYMDQLKDGGPRSLIMLSIALGLHTKEVVKTVERQLIAQGWLVTTRHGRHLTPSGLAIARGQMRMEVAS